MSSFATPAIIACTVYKRFLEPKSRHGTHYQCSSDKAGHTEALRHNVDPQVNWRGVVIPKDQENASHDGHQRGHQSQGV